MKQHISLIEPDLAGHHKVYLSCFYNTLIAMGYKVSIYTTNCELDINKDSFVKIEYRSAHRLPQNFWLKKMTVVINFFLIISNLISLKKKIPKKSTLFFCCIDQYMHELLPVWLFDKLITHQFSGLLLSPFNRRKTHSFFDRRKILKSRNCKSIGVLDEYCLEEIKDIQKNVIHFPDFSDNTNPNLEFRIIQDILSRANGRKIVSLLGGLSIRKGYRTFIKSTQYIDSNSFFFVIAGKLHQPDKAYFESIFLEKENCFFFNDVIPSEAEFNAFVHISDIIYAAYLNFPQSSNMLSKAAFFKKPIIVSRGFYMEKIVRNYRLGEVIEQDSAEECANAIENMPVVTEMSYNSYLKKNSSDNLYKSFQDICNNYEI